jgi:hypothetical protein
LAERGWQREFDDPIPLPDGRTLVTLRDAGDYIANLPKKESDLPEWQDAVQALMLVEHGWPMMFAQWRDASIEPRPQNCLAATHRRKVAA